MASLQLLERAVTRTSAKVAGSFLLMAGLAAIAHAQATWVGGASQAWNTAANWSTSPTNPSGNFTINTATDGVYPILTGASAFAPVDIIIGTGSGKTGRLDLNNATLGVGPNNTGGTNWLLMGINGGTATLNIGAGSTFLGRVHMLRTTVSSTATINVDGTLSSPLETVISDGQNNQPAVKGTMNVNAGGVVNSEGDLILAWAGNSSTFGELNIAAGATVNVASTTERWLIMNQWDGVQARLTINGGALNLNANTDIRFNTGNCTGPGTLTLNSGTLTGGATSVIDLDRNVNNGAVNNTLNLNGGTLTIGQIISGIVAGTRTINFNGTTLKPAAAGTFITATAASAANVKAGGVIIESNGFDITVAKALTADATSTGGGLTKLGTGTLTLSGVNTYTGNTTVSAGGLSLPDNASLKFVIGANGVNTKVTGATTGAIALDGDFEIDVTNAGATLGNSWQIVDSALNKTYGATFTVTGFTLTDGKWIKPANGAFYSFDTATSRLTVVTDPAIVFPPPTVTPAAARASYPIGSDFTLGVAASGTGTLAYQWYYQATSGATPVAIGGATGATYPITGATSVAGGIYSVKVTDSAAPTTPTTVTFAAITVLPGTDFTLAYYRFEEGPADAFITNTIDSIVGGDNLTVLGTPNYAADSLPYAKVPRTGATNTLGANFPSSGNHGLIAPTNGALAAAEMLDFTVEAFVRLDSLAGWQTIVGRDDSGNPGQGVGGQGLFYLSKANNGGFRVELINKDNTNLQINSSFVPTVGTWYHLAAVGDSAKGTLTLYVNGNSVGSTTGFAGLLVPATGSDTPWTLGRGDYAAADVDFLRGDLDEVRFSRAALPPSQFLAATDAGTLLPPVISVAPVSRTLRSGDSATLSVTATGTSTNLTYEWYKNGALISGQTTSSLALNSVTTAADATYSVKIIDPIGTSLGVDVSTTTSAVVHVLAVSTSARAIGLNFVGTSNGGSWSTEIASLAAGTSAGFIPAANWNNSGENVASQTAPLTLVERSGATPSYTTAVWASANTWSARLGTGNPTLGEKTADASLLHGYIESRASTGATVSVANIPYGTYDVYVYVAGGVIGNVGSVSINRDGSPIYYYKVLQHDTYVPAVAPSSGSPYSLPFMIGDSTTRAAALTAPAATFVRFTGLSGADLTFSSIDSVLNANAGGIAAVQIVDTTPAGTAYPPTVTTAPSSLLRVGGASASLSVSAVSNNSGGVLSYQWQKDAVDLPGKTGSSLSLPSLSSADTGRYTVVVTDTTSGGSATTSRTAAIVVVDANRALLINGDLGTSAASVMPYSGVLLSDGTVSSSNVGVQTNTWNNVATAAGSGSGLLSSESSGLALSGLSLAYAGVGGSADSLNEADGAIDISGNSASGAPILRDLAYTDSQTVPMTLTVRGLQAMSGHRVKLVVYASGFSSKFSSVNNLNDAATITLASANNHLGQAPAATDNSQGRDLRYNAQAFVTFDGVVAADGTVAWNVGADSDGGRIPVNAFQLLVTSEEVSPPVPTGLAATAGNAQVGLTWNASAGAATYTIARSTSAGGAYTTLSAGVVATNSYTDATAVNGTTYYYVVSSANALATSAYSVEASATPVNSGTALQLWRQSKFGSSANSGNGADAFDADSDGIPNLLEYALGTEPLTPNSGSAATVARSGNFLTLGFHHIGDATLVYSIEGTNDVSGSWTTVQTYQAFSAAGDEVYQDTVSLATQPRRFLRLRVTTP